MRSIIIFTASFVGSFALFRIWRHIRGKKDE